jgi:quercetin dioxygenase-like cupin family protein
MKMIKNLTSLSSLVLIGKGRGKTARTVVLASVAMAGLVTAVVRTAMATPPFNIVSATVVARASFVEPTDVKFKVNDGSEEVIHVPEAQETVMQQIIIGPGGSTGWHSHPGPVVVLIKAGELALYSSDDPTCTPRIYSAGQAFVESGQGHVNLARNLSTSQNVELWATYFDVLPGGPFRLDAANLGNCGF